MITHFTPVTGYFKLNAMTKRQMCRQAAKMLQSYLQSQGNHSVLKHSLQYTKHTVLTHPWNWRHQKQDKKCLYSKWYFLVSSFWVTLNPRKQYQYIFLFNNNCSTKLSAAEEIQFLKYSDSWIQQGVDPRSMPFWRLAFGLRTLTFNEAMFRQPELPHHIWMHRTDKTGGTH